MVKNNVAIKKTTPGISNSVHDYTGLSAKISTMLIWRLKSEQSKTIRLVLGEDLQNANTLGYLHPGMQMKALAKSEDHQ